MANTQAFCTSAKPEFMNAVHQLGSPTIVSRTSLTVPTVDSLKAALYAATATIDSTATVYTVTGEVTGTGYTAGGIAVTNATGPSSSGTTGFWTPSASLVYSTVTLTAFDAVLIYNFTQGNKAISVHTFGSQSVTAANFTLTMPANAAATALLRIA